MYEIENCTIELRTQLMGFDGFCSLNLYAWLVGMRCLNRPQAGLRGLSRSVGC